jgi:hypothetical protein
MYTKRINSDAFVLLLPLDFQFVAAEYLYCRLNNRSLYGIIKIQRPRIENRFPWNNQVQLFHLMYNKLKNSSVSFWELNKDICLCSVHLLCGRRDSAVAIATGYGLDDRGVEVRVSVGSRIFSSSSRSDRFWAHSASYPMDTGGFLREWSGRRVKLTTHLQVGPRSRKLGSIHPLPHTPSCRSA